MQSLWILVAALLTCAGYAVTKAVDPATAFFEILFVRSGFMLAAAALLALATRTSPLTAHPGLHLARALTGVAALSLNIVVVRHLPLAVAQTLIYMSPVLVAAWLALRGMLSGRRPKAGFGGLVLAVLAGFAGVVLINRPGEAGAWLWCGLALLSAALVAASGLLLARLGRFGEPPVRTVLLFALASVIASGAACAVLSSDSPLRLFADPLLLAIGLTTAGAQLAQAQGWGKGGRMLCAAMQFSAIPFAALLDAVCFGKVPDAAALLGVAVIMAAEAGGVMLERRRGAGALPVPERRAR
mgnify:CR=1 FL=1